MSVRKCEQISVPLPPELRERLEALDQREDRTLAAQRTPLARRGDAATGPPHLDDGRPAP
jgi:hypothetical protein